MYDRLRLIKKQYDEILIKLQASSMDMKEMKELLKKQSDLSKIVDVYDVYLNVSKQIQQTETMMEVEKDKDIVEMAKIELQELQETLDALEIQLKVLLLPKDPNDDKNIIMEIKGAAGGDEGNIFAGDLFRLYTKFSEANNFKIELLNAMEGAMGGYTSIEFMISGKGVYSLLKYESGTHRVQRVPETESQGRIHTSTAVVLVMPEAEEIEIDVKWDDIRVDTFTSSGPGGQSVNTTKSAVRLTHLPTNIAVACQEGKSQHENKDKAFRLLKARIFDSILQEQVSKEEQARKELIGRGDRSEKIRTYNYPQNRVTDHRIGLTLQRLDAVMEGKLELIIEPVINEFQKRQIAGEV
jgi:peptide chain release factor 1